MGKIEPVPAATADTSAAGGEAEARALWLHSIYRGKVQIAPKCPITDFRDFSVWYSPGVAAPCRAIKADPGAAYLHTNKGNSIAVVSDGTRVLGLGDIGPLAGLPVMEGKALLFKYLGGVDAVPLCLDARDPETFIRVVQALEPSFGGINLEDIAQPKCFGILAALRETLSIPVWHDDQQGSATAVVAGMDTGNVDTVVIAGRVMKREGELLHVDWPALKRMAAESRDHVIARSGFKLPSI